MNGATFKRERSENDIEVMTLKPPKNPYLLVQYTLMKLIVTIPAYNEEKTIGEVIRSVPRYVPGIDQVEILVLSDGSTDRTIEVAREAGTTWTDRLAREASHERLGNNDHGDRVIHVLENKHNIGLAKTFARILHEALIRGADVIVNTDADNQYNQSEIALLIAPIINGTADMVNGDRQVKKLTWMPTAKKYGNMFGSALVRKISNTRLKDASSGFRAFTREAAQKFILLSEHTYTHETIIQAGNKNLTIVEIPITFKERTHGDSRLISNVRVHIQKSLMTIFRSVMMYKAFKVLAWIGCTLILLGGLVGIRFTYHFLLGEGAGHIQSLILSAILIITGVNTVFLGVLADLISHNRKILEMIYEKKQYQ